MIDAARWLIAVPLGLFGALGTAGNYAYIVQNGRYRRQGINRHCSLIPLLGGGSVCVAMLACPLPGAAYFAWLPLVIDPGCLLLFGGLTLFLLTEWWRRR